MNRRQANKKMMFTTEFEKDWRTWFKYHVPFYVHDFSGKLHKITSKHAYMNLMYESTYFKSTYLRHRKELER